MKKEEYEKAKKENGYVYQACQDTNGNVWVDKFWIGELGEKALSCYSSEVEAIRSMMQSELKLLEWCRRTIKGCEKWLAEHGEDLNEKQKDAVIHEDTQWWRIVRYMDEHGEITPLDAYNDLGITKLATRISELRARGFKIHGKSVEGVNRFGEPVRFNKYWMEGKNNG